MMVLWVAMLAVLGLRYLLTRRVFLAQVVWTQKAPSMAVVAVVAVVSDSGLQKHRLLPTTLPSQVGPAGLAVRVAAPQGSSGPARRATVVPGSGVAVLL